MVPEEIWGPGIDLRTPWKNFSLRPCKYCIFTFWIKATGPTHGDSKKHDKIHNTKLLFILTSDLTPIKSWLKRYPYTLQKNVSPKIICQKNISLNVLFPELTFVGNHTCQNEHLPEITSARMNTCLNVHLPE